MALRPLDLMIIAVYLAGITLFGIRFRKSQRTLQDYFLAGRNVPTWANCLSIVAAETSTLTIISVPGLAYAGNLGFLQVALGYCVGRVVISLVLLPHYFRGELFTAYELIERRFGLRLRSVTAAMFLLTRAAAEGVRVWSVAIVVMIAVGTGEVASVAIITLLTVIYTFEGGLAAVIWTDVIQLFVYVSGAIAALVTILQTIPGGWDGVARLAAANGKFQIFNFSTDPNTTYTFWAGLIGGSFLTMASHGTDQLIVQRLLAAPNRRSAQTALIGSGLVIFVQFTLFLLIGVALFAFYQTAEPGRTFAKSDLVFPTFAVTHLPVGITGLLMAAILAAAMSNLSSALSSMTSTSMMDFYLRRNPDVPEQQRMRLSRLATVFWAAVLFGLALWARRGGSVLELGLSIASVAYGAMLGVFLLGVLTRRANASGALAGMAAGLAVEIYLWTATKVGWTWYVAVGTVVTFAVGYTASRLFPSEERGETTHG
jgi:SSS family transporter